MKIAIVHNDYGKFSGEEAVVRDHKRLLIDNGYSVIEFRRSSAELKGLWGSAKGFLAGIYNPFSQRRFAKFLDEHKPDIVHVHNLYPLINPCILGEAKKRKIPVVMTVHNFRLFCANGVFTVNNRICEECAIKNSVRPAIKHNCLNSRFKSLGYALRTYIAKKKGWYLDNVDRFLCLTEFQRQKLIEYGIPKAKTAIIPNFINKDWLERSNKVTSQSRDYIAYMGRLSEEKGIELILDVARKFPEISFKFAGNGSKNYCKKAPKNVEFVGYLTEDEQFEFIKNAKIQIMASLWYEGFPTTLLQGMALGVVSLVPNHGGMPEIIKGAGESFEFKTMVNSIENLYFDDAQLAKYQQGAKDRIQDFCADTVGKTLELMYREVIENSDR